MFQTMNGTRTRFYVMSQLNMICFIVSLFRNELPISVSTSSLGSARMNLITGNLILPQILISDTFFNPDTLMMILQATVKNWNKIRVARPVITLIL